MLPEELTAWRDALQDKRPREIVRWAAAQFGRQLALATGLGAEDQIITHLCADNAPQTTVVFVDTGRHFQQTHELLQHSRETYRDLEFRVFMPNGVALEEMLDQHGTNLFRQSPELRRHCCLVRKHEPLKRALAPFDAYFSGRRRDQAPEREQLQVVEWDEQNELVRINPLWNWNERQVWDFVRLNAVETHELHTQGYAYPGCAPCTRAVKPGEPSCIGRWWWEQKRASCS